MALGQVPFCPFPRKEEGCLCSGHKAQSVADLDVGLPAWLRPLAVHGLEPKGEKGEKTMGAVPPPQRLLISNTIILNVVLREHLHKVLMKVSKCVNWSLICIFAIATL